MAWTMLYAHDANGKAAGVDLAKLIEAVERGRPVRFLSNEAGEVAVADAQRVYARNQVVLGEDTANVSGGFQGDRLLFQEDAFPRSVAVSTRGDRDMSRRKVGEHTTGGPGHTHDRVALRWFADL